MTAPRQLVLTGMMGAGKSTVATALGMMLGRRVFDLDAEIEQLAGRMIPEIFASDGEPGFRRLELSAYLQIQTVGNPIVALGGGAFCTRKLRDAVNESGVSVYLHADPKILAARLASDREHRPLLSDEGWEEKLDALYRLRDPIYRMADFVIETRNKSAQSVAEEVIRVTT